MARATTNTSGIVPFGGTAFGVTTTLMFTDLEDSTPMTERLGDRQAFALMQQHDAIVVGQVLLHGGRAAESRGDGFLLAFPSPDRALSCASAIHRSFAAEARRRPGRAMRVRIGIHTGEAIFDGDRYFGKSVVLAARITAQARAGETLVSASVRRGISGEGKFCFDVSRDAALKGLAGTYRLYSARWKKTVLRIFPRSGTRRKGTEMNTSSAARGRAARDLVRAAGLGANCRG